MLDAAEIVILNDNFSGIDVLNQALIILYRGVYENDLLVRHGLYLNFAVIGRKYSHNEFPFLDARNQRPKIDCLRRCFPDSL